MNFEVCCDESGLEALTNKSSHHFVAIGGLWYPEEYRPILKRRLREIKGQYTVGGEIKWQKVSPRYLSCYKEVLDYFFQTEQLRFRCIIVETAKVDHIRFNNADGELGFYKFYYQMLNKWILDFNAYTIFTDLKVNRNGNRLKDLKRVLERSNLTSQIKDVQGLPSEQVAGIQLADLLTGMVNAKFNAKNTSAAKLELIRYTEEKYLGRSIAPTYKWEEKLNIFRINLQGGW